MIIMAALQRVSGEKMLIANVPSEHRHLYRNQAAGGLFRPTDFGESEEDNTTWSECQRCAKWGEVCVGIVYWAVQYEAMPKWCEPAVRLTGSDWIPEGTGCHRDARNDHLRKYREESA